MGKTGEQFLAIRELEQLQYSADFGKKEVVKSAKKAAKEIMNRGEVTPTNALSNVVRLTEFFKTLESELRGKVMITEKHTENGVEFSFKNTGDRLNYEQDEVYKSLKEQLKERENLLKTAYKTKGVIYDEEGVEVPKVGIKTYGKQTLNLKF